MLLEVLSEELLSAVLPEELAEEAPAVPELAPPELLFEALPEEWEGSSGG